ncbi:Ig 2 and fn3 and I-set domain containing protein [Trichuris trichiura]|uniref:Ig 2 and fn3 and I-set domain containing protein n=1 Tax=Trichuris trichiura TaxID=36087 RepID=A0A077Z589_TRITR|nr:Ig 2 and fn3 and I-set domain containing protein [Trichuris trichiura]
MGKTQIIEPLIKELNESLFFQERLVVQDDLTLVLTNALPKDSGLYWCVIKYLNRPADTPSGKRIHLVVHSPPEFTKVPPKEVFKKLDDELKLICEANGNPRPKIQWKKDGHPLSSTNQSEHSNVISSLLVIKKMLLLDNGTYSCIATNTFSSEEYELNVRFADPAKISLKTPAVQYISNGTASYIECIVLANPAHTFVLWSKDGEMLDFNDFQNPAHIYTTENGQRLHFKQGSRSDAGIYTCQAYNEIGASRAFDIHAILSDPPHFTTKLNSSIKSARGSQITLSCTAAAEPTPSIKWFKEGKLLHTGNDLVIPNTTYKDHGEYECIASNVVATIKQSVTLKVTDTPPQKLQYATVKIASKEATLQWNPGFDGGHEQHFIVRYRKGSVYDSWTTVNVSKEFRAVIDGLTPDTNYVFEIVPVNAVGEGQSTILEAQTQHESISKNETGIYTEDWPVAKSLDPFGRRKPTKPVGLNVSASPLSVVLRWSPGKASNVPVYYYSVEYRQGRSSPRSAVTGKARNEQELFHSSHIASSRVEALHLNMSGSLFEPGTIYELRVRSHSMFTASDPSKVLFRMPYGRGIYFSTFSWVAGGLIVLVLLLTIILCVVKAQSAKRSKKVPTSKADGFNYPLEKTPFANGQVNEEGSCGFHDNDDLSEPWKCKYSNLRSKFLQEETRKWNLQHSNIISRNEIHLAKPESIPSDDNGTEHEYASIRKKTYGSFDSLSSETNHLISADNDICVDKECENQVKLFMNTIASTYFNGINEPHQREKLKS